MTGGAGFIGRHVSHALVERGAGVQVLDIAARRRSLPATPGIDYVQGSILDEPLVDSLVREADIVVHLAGIAEPMRYGTDPLATMDVNLLGSITVVRCCANRSVPVVFSSTSEVYGLNPNVPWAEDADRVLGPVAKTRWCYSSAKAAVEHYLAACRQQLGLDYTVVRLFNTYGAGLGGRVVDQFIRRALAGQPLVLHGDGEQTRCFCHVDDVTDALVRIVTGPPMRGKTYNVGSQAEISIADLAQLVIELTQSRSTVTHVPGCTVFEGFQDVPRRRPDIGAIRRDFGWEPSTTLRAGLRQMIDGMRDRVDAVYAG